MPSIGEIQTLAYNGVGGAIPGLVQDATFEYETRGGLNRSTRKYISFTITGTGRAIIQTDKAISSQFPAYTVGPEDIMINLEGITVTINGVTQTLEAAGVVIEKGWKVTIGGVTRTINAVGDLGGVGQAFNVVAA